MLLNSMPNIFGDDDDNLDKEGEGDKLEGLGGEGEEDNNDNESDTMDDLDKVDE